MNITTTLQDIRCYFKKKITTFQIDLKKIYIFSIQETWFIDKGIIVNIRSKHDIQEK